MTAHDAKRTAQEYHKNEDRFVDINEQIQQKAQNGIYNLECLDIPRDEEDLDYLIQRIKRLDYKVQYIDSISTKRRHLEIRWD